MKTLRYFFLGSFALLLGVLSVSLQPTDANAASPYDNVVRLTDSLVITPSGSDSKDISAIWYGELVQSLDRSCELGRGVQYCNALAQVNLIPDSNPLQPVSWGIYHTALTPGHYRFVVNASATQTCSFSSSPFPSLQCPGSTVVEFYGMCGHIYSSDNCLFTNITAGSSVYISYPSNGSEIFLMNFHIIYPDGYQGIYPPDTFTPPETSDEKPNWSISKLIAYQLTVHDLNFNTFDPSLFTCDDELAPIIHYTLSSYSDGASGINMSGTQSSTVQFDFDLTGATPGKYRLAGKYECNEPTNFTQTAEIFFQIDVNGNQSFNAFTDCFIETFPFIDFQGCIDNMLIVINIMGVKIPSTLASLGEVPPGECHTLTVLNNWLSLPNPTVCKQVPSNVRSIITPFVTFALGLMTIKFLAQRRRDDL